MTGASLTLALAAGLVATPILWLHYLVLLVVPIALARPRLSALWFAPLGSHDFRAARLVPGLAARRRPGACERCARHLRRPRRLLAARAVRKERRRAEGCRREWRHARAVTSVTALGSDVDTAERGRATPSGVRSGVLIAAASLLATLLNYVFLLAAGRVLGADDYGALAALLGLLTVVLLPIGALQLAVSREVSRRRAQDDVEGAESFARTTLVYGLVATVPIVAVGLALVVPLRELLSIDSTAAMTFAVLGLTVAIALPIATGVLQGYDRFRAVALLYVIPFALRLVLLFLVTAAGFRLGGAVFAAVAAGIVTALLARRPDPGARSTRHPCGLDRASAVRALPMAGRRRTDRYRAAHQRRSPRGARTLHGGRRFVCGRIGVRTHRVLPSGHDTHRPLPSNRSPPGAGGGHRRHPRPLARSSPRSSARRSRSSTG